MRRHKCIIQTLLLGSDKDQVGAKPPEALKPRSKNIESIQQLKRMLKITAFLAMFFLRCNSFDSLFKASLIPWPDDPSEVKAGILASRIRCASWCSALLGSTCGAYVFNATSGKCKTIPKPDDVISLEDMPQSIDGRVEAMVRRETSVVAGGLKSKAIAQLLIFDSIDQCTLLSSALSSCPFG